MEKPWKRGGEMEYSDGRINRSAGGTDGLVGDSRHPVSLSAHYFCLA